MTTKEEILAIAGKPAEFKRENKYLVLKLGDIAKFLTRDEQFKLDELIKKIRVGRLNDGKHDQSYVCVASDWPMYEQVWAAVQAFVEGKPSQMDELRKQLAAAKFARRQAETDKSDVERTLVAAKAEIERLKASLYGLFELEKQLAAAQAQIVEHREAIDSFGHNKYCSRGIAFAFNKNTNAECTCYMREALAQPSDTSALEAIVERAGEVMRERSATVCDKRGTYYGRASAESQEAKDCAFNIRALPGVTLEDLK